MIELLKDHWLTIGLAALLAVATAGWNVQTTRLANERAAHAETKREQADAVARAEAAARGEEKRRIDVQQGIINATQQDLDRVRTELAAASTAGDKLRAAIDTWRKRAAAAGATVATVGPSEPVADPIGMFADLLERADSRAEKVGRYADELRATGLACERQYDSLATP